jgi:pyridinium-3,5-bisthiocarboxylic acid mononucleotide nickel chelatase
MRIAYLDCFSGISGDMFVGALVDAGVSPRLLEETVAALEIGARIEITRVLRAGVSATKVDVIVQGLQEVPADEHGAGHGHCHSHGVVGYGEKAQADPHLPKAADVGHRHEEGERGGLHQPGHANAHRGLREICEVINRAPISSVAKQRALAMFEALGRAEAKIHNIDVDRVRFHEVGAQDAIVDIVCAAIGSEALGVDEWICSPLNVGGGTVRCAHGTFPVPVPATLEILKECGAPVYSGEVRKELVTPTGAAIVSVLARRFESFPKFKMQRIGYGAGFRELEEQPNVLRVVIGESVSDAERAIFHSPALKSPLKPNAGLSGPPDVPSATTPLKPEPGFHPDQRPALFGDPGLSGPPVELPGETETITILEANIDDLNPQVFGYAMERALAMGALDVFGVPVQMKKDRPGTLLTVLCRPEDAPMLTKLLFAETSTLGVRTRAEQRSVLTRHHIKVQTQWGDVRMKLGSLNGTVMNYAPEYEDCRRAAAAHGVPLKWVMQEAIRLFLQTNLQTDLQTNPQTDLERNPERKHD